ALDEADEWGAKDVRALALVEKGSALADWPGRREEAVITIRQAIAEADAVGDHVAVARAYNNMLGCISLHTREGRGIIAAVAAARGGYDAMARTKHSLLSVELAISEGDMALAQQRLDGWVQRIGEITPSEGQWPALNQVLIWVEAGRAAEAAALADKSLDLAS